MQLLCFATKNKTPNGSLWTTKSSKIHLNPDDIVLVLINGFTFFARNLI